MLVQVDLLSSKAWWLIASLACFYISQAPCAHCDFTYKLGIGLVHIYEVLAWVLDISFGITHMSRKQLRGQSKLGFVQFLPMARNGGPQSLQFRPVTI